MVFVRYKSLRKWLKIVSNKDRKQDGFKFPLDASCLVGFRSCGSNFIYNKPILKQIKRCFSDSNAPQGVYAPFYRDRFFKASTIAHTHLSKEGTNS